jgi:hypothetical protein
MASREQRSNREKKKPKAEKNKEKKTAPPPSPFSSLGNPTPPTSGYTPKKTS